VYFVLVATHPRRRGSSRLRCSARCPSCSAQTGTAKRSSVRPRDLYREPNASSMPHAHSRGVRTRGTRGFGWCLRCCSSAMRACLSRRGSTARSWSVPLRTLCWNELKLPCSSQSLPAHGNVGQLAMDCILASLARQGKLRKIGMLETDLVLPMVGYDSLGDSAAQLCFPIEGKAYVAIARGEYSPDGSRMQCICQTALFSCTPGRLMCPPKDRSSQRRS
jgi:hypothetical protein